MGLLPIKPRKRVGRVPRRMQDRDARVHDQRGVRGMGEGQVDAFAVPGPAGGGVVRRVQGEGGADGVFLEVGVGGREGGLVRRGQD